MVLGILVVPPSPHCHRIYFTKRTPQTFEGYKQNTPELVYYTNANLEHIRHPSFMSLEWQGEAAYHSNSDYIYFSHFLSDSKRPFYLLSQNVGSFGVKVT